MAVNPPNPVPIPEFEGTITMLTTDTLQLKFTAAGIFCTDDTDDFDPTLPDGQHFNVGDIWPDPAQFPNGACPAAGDDYDAKYKYHTHHNAKCGDIDDTPQRTISVGS
jgi:hypothetical protein